MRLTIPERILLLNVLPPAEGPYLFLRAVRALRESLGFSEDEAAEVGLSQSSGKVAWDPAKSSRTKEIEIGPNVMAYISQSIKAAPSLREEYLNFYSQFVGGE